MQSICPCVTPHGWHRSSTSSLLECSPSRSLPGPMNHGVGWFYYILHVIDCSTVMYVLQSFLQGKSCEGRCVVGRNQLFKARDDLIVWNGQSFNFQAQHAGNNCAEVHQLLGKERPSQRHISKSKRHIDFFLSFIETLIFKSSNISSFAYDSVS